MAGKKSTSKGETANGQAHTPQAAHKNARTRKITRYSQEDKLRAVTILATMGGLSPASHEAVNTLLKKKINYHTLSHWQTKLKDKIVDVVPDIQPKQELDISKIVADMREKLLRNLSDSVGKLAESVTQQDAIDKASLRDRYVSLGIGTDKLLLVAGRSPAMDNLVQRLINATHNTQYDPMSLLEDLVLVAEQKKQELLDQNNSKNVKLITSSTNEA